MTNLFGPVTIPRMTYVEVLAHLAGEITGLQYDLNNETEDEWQRKITEEKIRLTARLLAKCGAALTENDGGE